MLYLVICFKPFKRYTANLDTGQNSQGIHIYVDWYIQRYRLTKHLVKEGTLKDGRSKTTLTQDRVDNLEGEQGKRGRAIAMAIVRSYISANPWESIELPSCCTTRIYLGKTESPVWLKNRFPHREMRSQLDCLSRAANPRYWLFRRSVSSVHLLQQNLSMALWQGGTHPEETQQIHHYLPGFLKRDSMLLAESLLLLAKSHFKDYRSLSFRLARFNKMTHA